MCGLGVYDCSEQPSLMPLTIPFLHDSVEASNLVSNASKSYIIRFGDVQDPTKIASVDPIRVSLIKEVGP